jgi:hypothetical protein
MADLFTKILRDGLEEGHEPILTKKAREWFRETAQETFVRNQKQLIYSTPRLVQKTMPGFLYVFQYKAKTPSIPYYDMYPTVFPFRKEKDGFYGINLHYLPLPYRAILMDSLYSLTTDKNYDEETKLRLRYNILEGAAKFRYFRPCVKHYLNSRVVTRFALIPSNQWDIALFLPLERFTKVKGRRVPTVTVHRDSVSTIRKGK